MFSRVVLISMLSLASLTVSNQQERSAAQNPAAVKVEMTTLSNWQSGKPEPLGPYQLGSAIRFQVLMTNSSAEKLLVLVMDRHYQSRPRLIRNDEIVPYRNNISELIKNKEKNVNFYQLQFSRILEPGKPTPVEILDLRDWYEPLAPGHYQLRTRYRFDVEGEWTPESAQMKFEVVP